MIAGIKIKKNHFILSLPGAIIMKKIRILTPLILLIAYVLPMKGMEGMEGMEGIGGVPLQAMEINEKKKTETLVSEDDTDDTDSLSDLVLEWASVERPSVLGKKEGDGDDETRSIGHDLRGLPYKIAECLSCDHYGSFTDIYGNTLLHWGAEKGWLDIVEYFLPCIDCDIKNKKGETALFIAAKKGNLEIVKLLVKRGATLDKKTGHLDDENGATIDKETIEVAANSDIHFYLSTYKKNSKSSG